ncbi:hypothetical protein J6590_023547 [Homalodisca vitripennis]|nr:hypothetical protein J6590_023547 [Homalodisca vitripennis]
MNREENGYYVLLSSQKVMVSASNASNLSPPVSATADRHMYSASNLTHEEYVAAIHPALTKATVPVVENQLRASTLIGTRSYLAL